VRVLVPAPLCGVPKPDRAVWKALKGLALKGRRFLTWEEMVEEFATATAYWDGHRHPFVWGLRRHRPKRRPGTARVPCGT
jgi:hypothetical protein